MRAALLLALGLLAVLAFAPAPARAAFGIDFGSMWFKLAVVRGGSLETVLNENSKRKTASTIAFERMDRLYGDPAVNQATKAPGRSLSYTRDLLGRIYEQSKSDFADKLLYPYEIFGGEAGEILVRLDESHAGRSNLTAVEVMSMLLGRARGIASFSSVMGKDVVLAVPPFLTHQERQNLIEAAKLGGLNIVSMMSDVAAVAYHYAAVREKKSDELVHGVVLDIGAQSLKAAVFQIKEVPVANSKKNLTTPHVTILATTWDRNLGGRDIDAALARVLAVRANKALVAAGRRDDDVTKVPRAMAKLLREARRVKEVLSANVEIPSSVEGLLPDFDFQTKVTRKELEEICAPILARITPPLERLLKEANLQTSALNVVEVVGGAVRVPRILELLKQFFGREVDKHMDGDEAAVQGAALYAATLTPGVRVKEVKLKDLFPYSIGLNLRRSPGAGSQPVVELQEGDEGEAPGKPSAGGSSRVASFKRGVRLGSRKVLSIATSAPFDLDAAYLPDAGASLPAGAPLVLGNYSISGFEKLSTLNATGAPKAVVAFRLTSSALLELERAELEVNVWEIPPPPPRNSTKKTDKRSDKDAKAKPEKEKADKGAKAKTDSKKESDARAEKEAEQAAQEAAEEDHKAAEEGSQGEDGQAKESEAKEDGDGKTKAEDADKSDDKTKADDKPATPPPPPEPVMRVRRFPLKVARSPAALTLSPEAFAASQAVLADFAKRDKIKKEREEAKNSLESLIYSTRDELESATMTAASTEEERAAISSALTAAQAWLDEEASDATPAEDFHAQLELARLTLRPVQHRMKQNAALPAALVRLQNAANASLSQNHTTLLQLELTEEELSEMEATAREESAFAEQLQANETERPANVDPPVEASNLTARAVRLEFTLRSLLRRPFKPRPKPPKANATENATEDKEGGEGKEEGEEAPKDSGEKESETPEPTLEEIEEALRKVRAEL